MDIKSVVKNLATPLSERLSAFKSTAHMTRPDEVSLVNIAENVSVHLREDGILELAAGNCGFFLDGDNGTVASASQAFLLSNTRTNILTPSFSINSSQLNQGWLGNNPELAVSPLTFTDMGLSTNVIVGVPQEGQSSIPLTDLMSRKPLFLKPVQNNETIKEISRLSKLLEELNVPKS